MPLLDPFFSNVVLLTPFDTNFNDVSNNGIVPTTIGSPTIDTSTKKYGGSLSLNGSSYLTYTHSSFSTINDGNFIFNCWFMVSNLTTNQFIFDSRNSSGLQGCALQVGTTGLLTMFFGGTVNSSVTASAGNVVISTWYHISFRQYVSSNTGYISELFMNGVSVSGLTTTGTVGSVTNPMTNNTMIIGAKYDGTSQMTGFIDDFRYTNGVSRGKLAYVVPYEAYPTASTNVTGYTSILNGPPGTSGLKYCRSQFFGDRYQLTGLVTIAGSSTTTVKRARLIRDRDGALIGNQFVTSSYTFNGLMPDDRYTLIIYDMSGNYKAVVQDNLIPTLISGLP